MAARVLYIDQSDVGLYPSVGAQWGRRGRQHKIATHGRNQKVYLCGARDPHSGKLYTGFWPRKSSAAFVDFLPHCLRPSPQDRSI